MENFSIACDESTDISDTAQLGIFIRVVTEDFTETEELLALQSVKGTTKGEDIFGEVKKVFNTYNLDWSKLCGISTDGAPVMIGVRSGLVQRIKEELRNRQLNADTTVTAFHCIIHQENLCTKSLKFSHVIQPIIETVNFIRSRSLNHRQFRQFLDDLGIDHQDLIYHTEVCWLSKGKMLERVYELRQEIKESMQMKSKNMAQLEDQDWLRDFAFLVDITGHLNILNTQLQGRGNLANVMFGNIKAFQNKLMLLIQQLSNGKLTENDLGNHRPYYT